MLDRKVKIVCEAASFSCRHAVAEIFHGHRAKRKAENLYFGSVRKIVGSTSYKRRPNAAMRQWPYRGRNAPINSVRKVAGCGGDAAGLSRQREDFEAGVVRALLGR